MDHLKRIIIASIVFSFVFVTNGLCSPKTIAAEHPHSGMEMASESAHTLSIDELIKQGADLKVFDEEESGVEPCILRCSTQSVALAPLKKSEKKFFADAAISRTVIVRTDAVTFSLSSSADPPDGFAPVSLSQRE